MWLLLTCVLLTVYMTSAIQYTPEIQIQSGRLRGFVETLTTKAKIRKYLGIPFAHAERFELPEPPPNWTGVKDMTSFGKVCYQYRRGLPFGYNTTDMSEDCLNLNIYVPDKQIKSKLPVMVWIHGGGLCFGSNRIVDGSYLATIGDVIVVTVNYRLGPLGFMCTKDYGFTGNYGLHDQITALKWIKNNINKFDGDPKQVTIFGNSAGGASVSLLSLSPLARGLFKYAIMQSGVGTYAIAYANYQDKHTVRDYIQDTFSCMEPNVKDCLKALSPEKFFKTEFYFQPFNEPVIDGTLLADTTEALIRNKAHPVNPQHVLIGVADSDGSCFTDAIPELTGGSQDIFANPPTNKQSFFNAVQSTAWIGRFTTFNDYSPLYTQAVVCMYAGNIKDFTNITRNQRIILDVLTDGFFVAPGVVHANDYVHRGVKTFFYHAMYGLPMPNLFKIPNVVNAYHETEKFMVFGFSLKGRVKLYSGGSKLSREVIKMWSNFAKTGDPNSPNKLQHNVQWPEYNLSEQKYLVIKPKMEVKSNLRPQFVKFWDKGIRSLNETMSKMCS